MKWDCIGYVSRGSVPVGSCNEDVSVHVVGVDVIGVLNVTW